MTSPPRRRTKEIIDPSYPLLEANRSSIESIQRRTFRYGPTELDAHHLDIYYPPPNSIPAPPNPKPPILIFLHGGGLIKGSRRPSDLIHANLGAYFASKGVLTVIPSYRLVPSIEFPQGAEDVRDALGWVVQNANANAAGEGNAECPGDPSRIFILAHSAGGHHAAHLFLLSPSLYASSSLPNPFIHPAPPTSPSPRVRGIIFLGTPFSLPPSDTALAYYASPTSLSKNTPLALLRSPDLSRTPIEAFPHVLALRAQSEPRRIARSMGEFVEALRLRGCPEGKVEERVLEGHDHASPVLALGTGCLLEEAWAVDMLRWMDALVERVDA